jgi:hypothetical protein
MEKPLTIKGVLLPHCTINEYGRVWNNRTNREQKQVTNGKIDNPHKKVKFRNRGGTYLRDYVHRLVAEHFIGPCPEPDMVVNHKDGDPFNNHVSNLEWATVSENNEHYHNELKHLDRVKDDINNRMVYNRLT